MANFVSGASAVKWNSIGSAPLGRNVQLQVSDNFGVYPLPFLCTLTEKGWVNAETRKPMSMTPTGWREGRFLPKPKRLSFAPSQSKVYGR